MDPEEMKTETSNLMLPQLQQQSILTTLVQEELNSPPHEEINPIAWAIEGQSFPYKLRCIVDDQNFSDYVCWSDDGTAIVFPCFIQFVNNVLKRKTNKIFKTESLKSFVRQLNLYGFHKVPLEKSSVEFSEGCLHDKKMPDAVFKHSKFLRSRPDLLELVKRRCHVKAKRERHDIAYYQNETPIDVGKLKQLNDENFYVNNPRPLKRRLSFDNERFPVANHWALFLQQQQAMNILSEADVNCLAANNHADIQVQALTKQYELVQEAGQSSVPVTPFYYPATYACTLLPTPVPIQVSYASGISQSSPGYDHLINQLLATPSATSSTMSYPNVITGTVLSSSPIMASVSANPTVSSNSPSLPTINESFLNNISPFNLGNQSAISLLATPTTKSTTAQSESSPAGTSQVYSSLSPLSAFCASLFSPINENQSSASKNLQQQIFSSKSLSILAEEAARAKSSKGEEHSNTTITAATTTIADISSAPEETPKLL